jgi:hypothetical protein
VKHIKEHCTICNVELTDDNWSASWKKRNIKNCTACSKNNNNKSNPRNNPQRMFVNGKYIPKSHPLYKAGNFKTFEDAAFSSLSRYTTSSEGEVYIITNPAWKGWIKVGMAIDSEDRCKGYQTSSPLRDFKLKFKKYFDDRRTAEQTAHTLCAKKADKRKGEWFKLDIKIAKDIINNMEVV